MLHVLIGAAGMHHIGETLLLSLALLLAAVAALMTSGPGAREDVKAYLAEVLAPSVADSGTLATDDPDTPAP